MSRRAFSVGRFPTHGSAARSGEIAALGERIEEQSRISAQLMAGERKDALEELEATCSTRVPAGVIAALNTALASAHPTDIRSLHREIKALPETIDPTRTEADLALRSAAVMKM